VTEIPIKAAIPPPQSRSLATQLTAWYAFAAFTLVLIATSSLYATVTSNIRHTETELVADRLHTLRTVLNEDADPTPSLELVEEVEREWPGGARAHVYTRILDGNGQVLTETRGMKDRDLPPSAFPPPVALEKLRDTDVLRREPAGRTFALYSVRLNAGPESPAALTVQMGVDASSHYALLESYRQRMVAALVFTLLLATLIGHRIARRGFEPVERIGETLRRIRSSTLYERLDVGGLPVELSLLAATCNEMLDGLEESFSNLSRFSADIAHELRTPINNLRGEVEVALSRSRTADEYRSVLGSCLEETQRLSKLIASLLFLARAEGAAVQARKQPLDLAAEIAAVAEFYEALASEADVTLTVTTAGSLVIPVDRSLLQSALGNLVENAIAATPRGGRVDIHAEREGEQVRIDIADTGRGIAAADVTRVFDRLYRADPSRTGTGASGGAGLGLAIVKSIAALHGGAVSIRSDPSMGTTATLRLPATAT
jgi:two-component system heavy metal sensor histidine kinase CusS